MACLVFLGFVGWGCTDRNLCPSNGKQQVAPAAVQTAQTHADDIHDVLEYWTTGERDTAIRLVLELVAHPDADSRCRLYHMTEAEFAALPLSEQQRTRDEMLSKQTSLRFIARELMLRGEENETHGLLNEPREYYVAAKRLGAANRGAEVTMLIDLVGKSIEERADEAIARLDARRP